MCYRKPTFINFLQLKFTYIFPIYVFPPQGKPQINIYYILQFTYVYPTATCIKRSDTFFCVIENLHLEISYNTYIFPIIFHQKKI